MSAAIGMTSHEELRAKAQATYNAAADSFDAPANAFWDRFGRRTIERLSLAPGMHVLDVCSGTGASAIPAAEAVGPGGIVVAVDIAEQLLARLRDKAAARGLRHLDVQNRDLLELQFAEPFDAVVCVFGIFFVADMPGAVQRLWQHVAPGGRLAITTWGPRLFEPLNTAFWDAVRAERPDLYKGFNPWDVITAPAALADLFSRAGVPQPEIVAESATHPVPSAEAWWALVEGSGYRGTLEQLSPDTRDRIRASNGRFMKEEGVTEVDTNVVYAVARR